MLKYCWIIMLAVMWIIWLIATVIDIIDTYQLDGFCLDLFSDLDDSSQNFILSTFFGIFLASFISWFSQFFVG